MAKDILTDADNDIIINNDIVMGEADKQNLERLLMSTTGSIRHKPLIGCNLIRLTNARINQQEVIKDVRLQLEADSWKNEKILYDGLNLNVDAIR